VLPPRKGKNPITQELVGAEQVEEIVEAQYSMGHGQDFAGPEPD
jgi:hypothetical protein